MGWYTSFYGHFKVKSKTIEPNIIKNICKETIWSYNKKMNVLYSGGVKYDKYDDINTVVDQIVKTYPDVKINGIVTCQQESEGYGIIKIIDNKVSIYRISDLLKLVKNDTSSLCCNSSLDDVYDSDETDYEYDSDETND